MTREAIIMSAFLVTVLALPAGAVVITPPVGTPPPLPYSGTPIASWDFGTANPLVDKVGGRVMRIVEDRSSDVKFTTATDKHGVSLNFLNFTNGNRRAFSIVDHNPADSLQSGVIHIRGINTGHFNNPRETLVSKDHYSYGNGGHFTINFRRTNSSTGHIEVRLQSRSQSKYVMTSSPLSTNEFVDAFVTFGPDFGGLQLFLDRDLSDSKPAVLEGSCNYFGGIENNAEPWLFGSSLWRQNPPASRHGVDLGDLGDGLSGGIAGFSIHELRVIPEPGTFVLTVCGAFFLLGSGFRRRRK